MLVPTTSTDFDSNAIHSQSIRLVKVRNQVRVGLCHKSGSKMVTQFQETELHLTRTNKLEIEVLIYVYKLNVL